MEKKYTIKKASPMGDRDPKYGQTYIKLGKKDAHALIDSKDIEKVSKHSWYLDDMGYARGGKSCGHKRMHSIIMGDSPEGKHIDHINRDRLDNRKNNLRFVSVTENQLNSGLWRHNTSGHKGVSWDKTRGKWRVTFGRSISKRYNNLNEAVKARKSMEASI